jgi:tetratricopeptide (TPR) repeat protein
MRSRPRCGTNLAATLLVCALPMAGAVAESGQEPAFEILHEQAQYWTNRGRGDLAAGALRRILASDPDNPRALYEIGLLLIGEGDITSARTFEARLRRQEASFDLATQLRREIDNAEVDRSLLNEARRRAAEGEIDVALGLYEKLFSGREIGGRLAIEYYETLAGMEDRWTEAADGLRGTYANQPSNGRVRMALARVLSYREESRREALYHLSNLVDDGVFREEAMAGMRDALLWLNASPDDQEHYDRYLSLDADEAVAEKLALALNPKVIDAFTAARIEAYKALNQNQLTLATQRFTDLLGQRSNDAESLGGLGLVKLRQQQFKSAEDYLTRAIRADAATRRNFGQALADARFWGRHTEVETLLRQQNFDDASRRLASIEPGNDAQRARLQVLAARVALAKGDQLGAIDYSRRALAAVPGQEDAAAMLLNLLSSLGRDEELQIQLATFERRASQGEMRSATARAAMRRARARLAAGRGDWDAALAAYEQAITADSKDPWLRLEYARTLLRLNRRREAEAVMSSLSQRDAGAGAAHALALYYNDTRDWNRSIALIESLPPAERSPELSQLEGMVRIKRGIDMALQRADMGDRNTAVSEMLALQQRTADVPQKTMLVADGLLKLGLHEQAGLMVSRELAAGKVESIDSLVQYARILGEAGDLSAAHRLITDLMLRRGELSADQRATMATVYDDILLRASRRAMEQRQYELALSYLEPVHRADPLNGAALRHLGEVYQRRGDFAAAQRFYERAMAVDTGDLWAVKGAVGAALDAADIDSASRILEVALNRFPDHPDVYTLISRTAHSAKDLDMAIEAMERAKELRRNSNLPVIEEPYEAPRSPNESVPRISPDNPFRAGATPNEYVALPAHLAKRTEGTGKRAWHEGWSRMQVAERLPANAPEASVRWTTPVGGAALDDAIRAEIEATRKAMAGQRISTTVAGDSTIGAGLPAGLELDTIEQLIGILADDDKHGQVERVVLGVLSNEHLDASAKDRLQTLLYPSALHLAEEALRGNDYERAFEHIRPLLDMPSAGGDVRVIKTMAAYSRGTGSADKAATLYEKALGLTPDDEDLRLDAAALQIEQGDLVSANAIALAGIERNPQSARLHLMIGQIARALGDLDAAMEHFLLANEARSAEPARAQVAPAIDLSRPVPVSPRQLPADVADNAADRLPAVGSGAAPSNRSTAYANRLETLDLYGRPVRSEPPARSIGGGQRVLVATAEPAPRSDSSPVDIRERLRNLGREGPAGRDRPTASRQGVLTQTLDTELETLRAEASPFFSQSLGFRYRSGEEGLSKLTEFRGPFELDFNPFEGRVKMIVEPVFLTAGNFGDDPNRARRFGTFALIDEEARFAPVDDDAGGIGITFGYATGAFSIDVGTTPLDFEIINLVGGLNLSHEFESGFNIGFDLSRRAVTESLLSYAGAKDPLSGVEYGGVTNNEATLEIGQSFDGFSVYADGWYGINTGENIEDNEHFGGDFGFTVDLLQRPGRSLRAGFNTTYFSYDKNLRFFTLGHGGYFSPQRFFSSSIPIDYELANDTLVLRFSGAISVQHFSEDSAFYFPNRQDLQDELFEFESEQPVIHDGQTQTDLGFRTSGELIYKLTPRLQFRGYIGVERAADWTESIGLITVQYRPGL